MKRKIVKQGTATMTVSLPSSWIKKNNLSNGDDIDVEEVHNGLVINKVNAKVGNVFSFHSSTKGIMTARTIVGAYCLGYDEIDVKFSDPSIFKKVQDAVSELIGFEIINQTKSGCVIKELTGITEKEFNPVFRRFFRIVVDIFDEGLDAVKNKDKATIESLVLRDKDVNKFCNLSIRYLNKSGADNNEMTSTYIVICYSLEDISDYFKEILNLCLTENISKKELDLISEAAGLLKNAYEFTFKLDESLAVYASNSFEKIKAELKNGKDVNPKIHSLVSLLNSRIISLVGLQSPFSK
jgi:phosphate uptake regulator